MNDHVGHPDQMDEATWSAWFTGLSDRERQELARQLESAPRVAPSPGPQTDAFNSAAQIVGYGGAAGGGKSALIALLAILEHTRSVVFRADAKQLRGLIDDLEDFVGTNTGLNRQAGVFRFADRPGHMIEWGGIAGPGDENAWRGRPHDLFCVDEATEISEAKIRFLLTWLRTTIAGQRCRALFTFNPPGGPDDIGGGSGRWVIDFFAPWLDERHPCPAEPGELRWFATGPDGKEIEVQTAEHFTISIQGREFIVKPQSRTFIPALVTDNPFLSGTNYEQQLLSLEEPYRSQMLLGDFKSGITDAEYQVIPTAWIDDAMARWRPEGRRAPMTAMGCDVARGGRDATILARRHGWWWDRLLRKSGKECRTGPIVAAYCIENVRDGAEIDIDAIGVGASPYDFLVEAPANVKAVVGSTTQGMPRLDRMMDFANLRSCLYWLARKILDPSNGLMPEIHPDNRLRAELIAHRYTRATGVIAVEKKEDIFKRLRFSPDDADAFIYSLLNACDTPGGHRLLASLHADVDKDMLYGHDERQSHGSAMMAGPTGNSAGTTWMGA